MGVLRGGEKYWQRDWCTDIRKFTPVLYKTSAFWGRLQESEPKKMRVLKFFLWAFNLRKTDPSELSVKVSTNVKNLLKVRNVWITKRKREKVLKCGRGRNHQSSRKWKERKKVTILCVGEHNNDIKSHYIYAWRGTSHHITSHHITS